MMRIDIISAVPDSLVSPLSTSIVKRAQDKGLIQILVHNLRDYAFDRHRQIDDKPFGGGAGMLLKPEPFFRCIEALKEERQYDEVILTTPKGRKFSQKIANDLSLKKNLIIIAGHYKGIDERVSQKFVTMEISIGDFVLSGGELPALMITDAVTRLLPGAIHDSQSALEDSLMDGDYVEAPYYTRPSNYRGMEVPPVLLSGNDALIRKWKQDKSRILTEKWKNINIVE